MLTYTYPFVDSWQLSSDRFKYSSCKVPKTSSHHSLVDWILCSNLHILPCKTYALIRFRFKKGTLAILITQETFFLIINELKQSYNFTATLVMKHNFNFEEEYPFISTASSSLYDA